LNNNNVTKPPASPPIPEYLDSLISRALKEDINSGDITTNSIVGEDSKSRAIWKAKQNGVIAGLFIGKKVFQSLESDINWQLQVEEGQRVKSGDTLLTIEGSTRALLTGERTALNFVQRLCGIATQTAEYVKKLDGTDTLILDTRKTAPGFRVLDKYAVKTGGGENHRMGLYDMALIKENHISAAGGITNAVEAIRALDDEIQIEVEITNLEQIEEALDAGSDMIMLDNMSNEAMKSAVKFIGGKAKTEASGNITLNRLKEIAETGVDYISAGALTHSVKAFDISQTIK